MKYSIHDGPGIRNTVFLKGCPLNCWWCHNPESQKLEGQLILYPNRCVGCGACIEACQQNAIKEVDGVIVTDRNKCINCGECTTVCYTGAREMDSKTMTVDEVVVEVLKDMDFFEESKGGVTFSGGEPLAQGKFLLELLKKMKIKGIHTVVDTSGFAPWELLKEISQYTDLFLYDLKHMDTDEHKKYTGVANDLILENLKKLSQTGAEIIIRIPIIPNINDGDEDLKQFKEFIKELPNIKEVNILPYHKMGEEKYKRLGLPYRMPDVEEPNDEDMEYAKGIIEGCGLRVQIGG